MLKLSQLPTQVHRSSGGTDARIKSKSRSQRPSDLSGVYGGRGKRRCGWDSPAWLPSPNGRIEWGHPLSRRGTPYLYRGRIREGDRTGTLQVFYFLELRQRSRAQPSLTFESRRTASRRQSNRYSRLFWNNTSALRIPAKKGDLSSSLNKGRYGAVLYKIGTIVCCLHTLPVPTQAQCRTLFVGDRASRWYWLTCHGAGGVARPAWVLGSPAMRPFQRRSRDN